jgi:hypothetical protein
MDITNQDRALINDLINIAWQSGAVKSPQTGAQLEQLRKKFQSTSSGESPAPVRETLAMVKDEG